MNKGFATALVLLLIVAFVAISIGSAVFIIYTNNTNKIIDSTSQPRNISQTTDDTNQIVQKNSALQQLLDKMKSYKNYQVDITLASGKTTTNWKILRVNNKQSQEDTGHPSLIITYKDLNQGKSYSYLKESNKYMEDQLSNSEFNIGTPEYYFKDWTNNTKIKGEDTLNGEKVTVYEDLYSDVSRAGYINSETGLPIKTYRKSATGESTITFKFSRINEVQEKEVTIPSTAKQFSAQEMEQGKQFLDNITGGR